MKTTLPRLLAVIVGLFVTGAHAQPPPPTRPETMFADPDMQTVKISPTGRYLTWLAPKNKRMNLAIQDRETKQVRWLTNMKEENVVNYVWAKRIGCSSSNNSPGASSSASSRAIRTAGIFS